MSDFRVESVSDSTQDSGIQPSTHCKIRVLGIGGGGGNSLQHMINESLSGVEFIAINTDSQALAKTTAPLKVQIGVKLTGGLGAGCDPNKGRKAAEESKEDIKKLLMGSDMVFITAGMGGGTGTGAAPIIAEIARETGALTVAVVTKPFRFEGKRHMVNAESGITELSKHVDSLIVIDNDKLLKNLGANISIVNAFNEANDVLLNAVKGITDSITNTGYINLDFADVQTVMRGRGHAMIGNGVGQGANFVEDAVERAIHSPLIEPVDISSAAGLLVNVRTNPNFPIAKWQDVCDAVQAYADEEADCKFGLTFDEALGEDEIAITILITGISASDTNLPENAARTGRLSNDINRPNVQRIREKGFFDATRRAPDPRVQPAQVQPQAPKSPFTVTPTQGRVESVSLGNTSIPSAAAGFSAQNDPVQAPSELPLGGSKSDDDSGLWDLPPILRNKSE
ncbi:MAG: cell division protein FtsZ [Succinivibrio sp.]|jgi:cell division protein FtsZ|nr:cell division protein FtsZ [Succinivibrio sp.]